MDTYDKLYLPSMILNRWKRQVKKAKIWRQEPDHQAEKQEQVLVPTIDLPVHIAKPLSSYQRQEDSVPQEQ